MLKLGIHKPDQDTPSQRRWRRGLMSATLLRTATPPSAEDGQRFDRVMSHLRLSSGVVRTTARNRFSALDEKLLPTLLGFFPPRNDLRIDDLAVSSGVTAAEWFRTLRSVCPQLTFTASDQVLYLIEAAVRNSRAVYIVEPKGEPIQYIYPPFVVSLAEDNHPGFLVNRLVQRYAKKRWHDSLASQFRIPPEFDGTEPSSPYVDLPAFRLAKISLVHPEVLALRSSAFQFTEHSVFSPLHRSADVIRTMNILNRAYFPESELRRAISAIHQSLTPGGLWIVGRTVSEHPPAHDVSVLRKTQAGWSVVTRIGNGSEVEALACTPHLEPAHA